MTREAALALRRKRADLLLKDLRSDEAARAEAAAGRFARLPWIVPSTPQQALALRDTIRHKHALHVIALEEGCADWAALVHQVAQASTVPDAAVPPETPTPGVADARDTRLAPAAPRAADHRTSFPRTCILTGAAGEDPDDCTTHAHMAEDPHEFGPPVETVHTCLICGAEWCVTGEPGEWSYDAAYLEPCPGPRSVAPVDTATAAAAADAAVVADAAPGDRAEAKGETVDPSLIGWHYASGELAFAVVADPHPHFPGCVEVENLRSGQRHPVAATLIRDIAAPAGMTWDHGQHRFVPLASDVRTHEAHASEAGIPTTGTSTPDTPEADRRSGHVPPAGCRGCGRVDPCGEHYPDCTLLEPGDTLVERGTERRVGVYDGPDRSDNTVGDAHPSREDEHEDEHEDANEQDNGACLECRGEGSRELPCGVCGRGTDPRMDDFVTHGSWTDGRFPFGAVPTTALARQADDRTQPEAMLAARVLQREWTGAAEAARLLYGEHALDALQARATAAVDHTTRETWQLVARALVR